MPSIIPTSSDQIPEIARRLLEAADSPDQVVTTTSGERTAFSVPDDVAARAGFGDGEPVEAEQADQEPQEPPRSGKGSSEDAWRAFLADNGIDVPEDAKTRDDLIELWDRRTPEQG
jgi:hypothetical protein